MVLCACLWVVVVLCVEICTIHYIHHFSSSFAFAWSNKITQATRLHTRPTNHNKNYRQKIVPFSNNPKYEWMYQQPTNVCLSFAFPWYLICTRFIFFIIIIIFFREIVPAKEPQWLFRYIEILWGFQFRIKRPIRSGFQKLFLFRCLAIEVLWVTFRLKIPRPQRGW
jgi:hypothetical protein